MLKCKFRDGGDTAVTATQSRCHALPGGEIKSSSRAAIERRGGRELISQGGLAAGGWEPRAGDSIHWGFVKEQPRSGAREGLG